MKKEDLDTMYANYGRTSDDKIHELLERIKIVHLRHKGVGTIYGYYPLSEKSMQKIREKPRGRSLTFDAAETVDSGHITNLIAHKRLVYLVKCPSRFFLKPDIGEIFDQMTEEDFQITKAISFSTDNYETLPNNDGEHHLVVAVLLKSDL